MTSRLHSILPRIALWSIFLVPIALFVMYHAYTKVYEVPRGGDIFAVVRGAWAWTPGDSACHVNPHHIAFTADRHTMSITAEHAYKRADGSLDSIAYYEIVQSTRSSIRGVLRGETRLTRDSQPVEWDLVLKSANSYTWRRTDWPAWQHTRTIQRCPVNLIPRLPRRD